MNEIKLYKGKVKLFYDERIYREEKYQTFYDEKGNKIKSVTKYIKCLNKEAIKFWAANLAAEYFYNNWDSNKQYSKDEVIDLAKAMASAHSQEFKEKGARGKLIHLFAEHYFSGKRPAIPEDSKVLNGVNSFLKWSKESELVTIDTERILYSKKYNIVGKTDNISKMKGKSLLHIVDYKSVSMYKKAKAWELEMWPDGLARGEDGKMIKYPIFLEPKLQVSTYRGMAIEEDGKEYGDSYIIRFDQETGDFDVETVPVKFQDEAYNMYARHLTKVSDFLDKYEVKYNGNSTKKN